MKHGKVNKDSKGQPLPSAQHVLGVAVVTARVEAPPSNDSIRLEAGPLMNGTGAFYIAAICACALILVIGSVTSALYIRNSKARVQESHEEGNKRDKEEMGMLRDEREGLDCLSRDILALLKPYSTKTLPCCSYSAAGTGGLTGSSVLVRVDHRPGSANSGSYATIADLEPLYARPCGSRASYYAASHVTNISQ
ncbi:hypothetical protein PV325_002839 [Microctonus aethiopoides]|nr:hypothetical protein PV325_002839 [Microctonus aethiopoides]KAK0092183.1 hypothetical protein PV326_001986 [Microctonus aethiopoides]